MIKNRTKKIFSIIALVLVLLNSFQGIVSAVQINSAYIENLGKCENHLQYYKASAGIWSFITTTMVGYRENGTLHYAYCIDPGIDGVGETEPYTVNVNQVLSDVRIWRVIINGFPYKSPAELGVENEQDAFIATKQAIYSIIRGTDVDSYYRGGTERGVRIFNALRNLVNIGRYGTQTPSNTNLVNVNKVGEFKADINNYYSQEYSVSSSVEMANYNITGISNFPSGSYVADMNNTARTSFSGGEHFKVLIPKNQIVNNINGTISVNGTVKSYPVFYGESGNPNLQDYALTYHAYTTESGQATLSVDAYKSGINIIKKDKETGETLSGVTYNAKYSDGTNIGNFTTDKNRKNNNKQIKTKHSYIDRSGYKK